MLLIFIRLLFLFLFTVSVHATDVCSNSSATLPSLDSVYKMGKFRVYYSSNPASSDYLENRVDLNNNSIPDYIENIAIQADTTLKAFTYLGFISPLESDRYKNVAEYIDIHVNLSSGNGLAYEGVTNYINKANKENKCTLIIQIRKNLEAFPGNWTTVTHEIFHLYEYGYSQFKGGWYLEGLANWSERILRIESTNEGLTQLPANETQLNNSVYNVDYNQLWHRFAYLSDITNGQLNLPSELLSKTYVDGSKVFKNERFKGHHFMKSLLQNFKVKSYELSLLNNRDPYRWSEIDQISIANRPYMLDAIQTTMLQHGIDTRDEEIKFIEIE